MNVFIDPSLPIDIPIAAVRMATGLFFAISGYNKLVVPERHAKLTRTLENDHIPAIGFMQWWVPGWELLAGVMLVLGLLTPIAALVLTIICIVACCCEAREKVESYHPINAADRIDDYLYLPEFLYICMLAISLFCGGGEYSLDNYLFY